MNAGIRVAELQRDMAVSGQRATLNAQRFMALGQYLDLFKIQNRMKVYEQNIALTRRLIDDIHAKQEQGMALKNDVTRYELQMETLRLMGGVYGYSMRHQMAENLSRGIGLDPTQALMVSIKQLYGVTCLLGVAFVLVLLLWNVQPVRSTMKKIPSWHEVARRVRLRE